MQQRLGPPLRRNVILSGVAASRSEAATQSKDPYTPDTSSEAPGGFYKRGCQVKILLPGRTARCFLGVQPWVGRPTTCARHTLDGFARLRQNRRRLAKRRQALLESNLPRNSQLETHRKAVGWGGLRLAPPTVFRPFDRFPHASKTRIVPPKTGSGRVRPDCRRFHGSYLSFDSDALQAGTGWHSTSRVGGGALPRWPPSAAQTVRADFRHTAFTRTPASGRENRAKVSER